MNDQVIHIAVDESTGVFFDDEPLIAAISRLGFEARPLVWGTDIPDAGTVVVRSTWDYHRRVDEFTDWLDALDRSGCRLVNPAALVRWNIDKRYLTQLSQLGVDIVPAVTIVRPSAGNAISPLANIELPGSARLVVKPSVGASADGIAVVDRSNTPALRSAVEAALAVAPAALVQPFLESINTAGEHSVVVIEGHPTHGILKRPAAGDWRVQHEFGGSAELIEITSSHRDTTRTILATLGELALPTPVYARVDLIPHEGQLLLNELELIEPELFLRLAPAAAERLAVCIAAAT